jgi:hypothetical protein
LVDHGGGGISSEDSCEVRRELAGDETVTAAEIEEEVLGTAVVGEDCGEDFGRIGWAEGSVACC